MQIFDQPNITIPNDSSKDSPKPLIEEIGAKKNAVEFDVDFVKTEDNFLIVTLKFPEFVKNSFKLKGCFVKRPNKLTLIVNIDDEDDEEQSLHIETPCSVLETGAKAKFTKKSCKLTINLMMDG